MRGDKEEQQESASSEAKVPALLSFLDSFFPYLVCFLELPSPKYTHQSSFEPEHSLIHSLNYSFNCSLKSYSCKVPMTTSISSPASPHSLKPHLDTDRPSAEPQTALTARVLCASVKVCPNSECRTVSRAVRNRRMTRGVGLRHLRQMFLAREPL
jgi:hypothetical protein